MNRRSLTLSVHQLVDFLLRAGDIDDRIYNQETMAVGSQLHSVYQKRQGSSYLSEVALEHTFKRPDFDVTLQGRADGVFFEADGTPVIDEIKSTVMPLEKFFAEQNKWHLGQAVCYAAMFMLSRGLSSCKVQLTYISQGENEERQTHTFPYSLKEAIGEVEGYIDEYLEYQRLDEEHLWLRDESVKNLKFPYEKFRKGQRELAKYAYGVGKKGGILYAEAPTGIGKTMSTLYPFIKSFQSGEVDKIFYLTAKNTGGFAAFGALGELYEKGFVGFDSFLLSKEKMCLSPGKGCNPDECPFTKDYFQKKKVALKQALLGGGRFDQIRVTELCVQNGICPFEFQLDLSEHSDVIICDYNYFFDPIVHLQRYFDSPSQPNFLVLVDEAHNLVDRGRDMYSASLSDQMCLKAKSAIKGRGGAFIKKKLSELAEEINFLGMEGEVTELSTMPEEILETIEKIHAAETRAKKANKLEFGSEFKDYSREANRLLKIQENYTCQGTRYFLSHRNGETSLNLFCVDPSPFLEKSLSQVKGSVVFSATLSPIDYYMNAISGRGDHAYLLLPSPFPKENFKLMFAPNVSVRYRDRAASYETVASYLKAFVAGKKGNYFLYFPSYDYLRSILPFLDFGDAEVHVQDKGMDQESKKAFLRNFEPSPKKTTVGLLIIGGVFGEGVDLVSDRLIGVAIVGIGLPQVGPVNDLIRNYYDQTSENGFDYAYRDPGMNRVMQAVGRLIRSETDVGAALLIDDRYMREEYRGLFSRTWKEYEVVLSPEEVGETLNEFYKNKPQ